MGLRPGGCVTLRNCRFGKSQSPQTIDFRENNRGTLKYEIADCSFVQTDVGGTEVTIPMDAAWCKANLAFEADADIELLPTPCDLAPTRSRRPETMQPSTCFHRFHYDFFTVRSLPS